MATTLVDVRDQIKVGATIKFRRHNWHTRSRGIEVTSVQELSSGGVIVFGKPLNLRTGTTRWGITAHAILWPESEVEIVTLRSTKTSKEAPGSL